MENIFKNKRTVILIIILIIVGIFFYMYFFGNKTPVSNSALTSQSANPEADRAIDKELFSLLSDLKAMQFDTAILTNAKFAGLTDFGEDIPTLSSGRKDPFLQIGYDPMSFSAGAIPAKTTATSTVK